jgi:hypothetical protein
MSNVSTALTVRLLAVVASVVLLTVPAAAAPSVQEMLDRVAAVSASAPNMTADVRFKLWKNQSSGRPPDCQFTGTMMVQGGHATMRMARGGTSLICAALNHYVVGRLFGASEPMASFLDRFDFAVVGDKQVGADTLYQLQGPARDPKNNPHAMSAWVDSDTGLISDSTLQYDWGSVDIEQQYTHLNNTWVLSLQTVRSSKYAATLQVVYSNFQFSP